VSALPLEPFTGQTGTPEHEAWMIDCEAASRAARARFAQRQARLGRPVPRSPTDPRPDPGTLDGEDPEG
jgi:hypothetical protein